MNAIGNFIDWCREMDYHPVTVGPGEKPIVCVEDSSGYTVGIYDGKCVTDSITCQRKNAALDEFYARAFEQCSKYGLKTLLEIVHPVRDQIRRLRIGLGAAEDDANSLVTRIEHGLSQFVEEN